MDTRTITLGGRDFVIPPLSFRQIRIVTLAAQRLNRMALDNLTDENLTDLFDIALAGAQKGSPSLTREELQEMTVTVDELIAAKRTVCEQAGMVAIAVGEPPART